MKKYLVSIITILLIMSFGIVVGFHLTSKKTENLIQSSMDDTVNQNNELSNNTADIVVVLPNKNSEISEEDYIKNSYNGIFELPLNGTTGFASVSLHLYKQIPSNNLSNEVSNEISNNVSNELSNGGTVEVSEETLQKAIDEALAKALNESLKEITITTLKPGQAFKILKESSDWFYVELSNSTKGWLESKYCLVNLPDLIPSIIYDDTNSYKSIFRSSGYALENITGNALYDAKEYNNRLEQEQYLMPLLYPMVKKIAQVQADALKNNDCLKIYETFRPYEVQMKVSASLTKLMESNEEVKLGITTTPWDKTWFIATQLSNHQRGVALDVSLAKVKDKEYKYCGSYAYFIVSKYEEYEMPTQMHELSSAAARFTSPVSSKSKTAWKSAKLAPTMTSASIKLQNYFTSHDLIPLASEWWHFDDLDAREMTKNNSSNGRYYLTECLSEVPSK